MLIIKVPESEYWDEINSEFVKIKSFTLMLEHSLISISKWESKWFKSFLSKDDKTSEELLDYIKCMTLNPQHVEDYLYNFLTKDNLKEINEYIESPRTATTFSEGKKEGLKKEIITSELIYYWMIALNIPFECQKWHLNRLLTLIRICNIKNQPPKKMGKRELMNRNTQINALRRQQMGTSG